SGSTTGSGPHPARLDLGKRIPMRQTVSREPAPVNTRPCAGLLHQTPSRRSQVKHADSPLIAENGRMSEIRIGTASWTDKTLLQSDWHPMAANNAVKRLAYYATQFPLVEVDSTYYAPSADQTAKLWAQRTPAGFVFNVKAYGLLTGHPTKVASL